MMEIHDMSMVLTCLAEAGVLSTEAMAACSEAAALLPKLREIIIAEADSTKAHAMLKHLLARQGEG